MFNCDICEETFGPRVKPTRAIQYTRNVEYHNEYDVEDDYGNKRVQKVDSVGTEIVKEQVLCAADAKTYFNIEASANPIVKPIALKFEEKQAPPIHNPLINVGLHNALGRTTHNSKRAERDSKVAVLLIKNFVDNNKDYVF